MGSLHEILWKKMFCAKKVTKLPDLTVPFRFLLISTMYLWAGEGGWREGDGIYTVQVQLEFQLLQ